MSIILPFMRSIFGLSRNLKTTINLEGNVDIDVEHPKGGTFNV
jgi:hypothetical protein